MLFGEWLYRLEIITPIRGRKLCIRYRLKQNQKEFRNNNPDKGTETKWQSNLVTIQYLFRNNNPDKGTETRLWERLSWLYIV